MQIETIEIMMKENNQWATISDGFGSVKDAKKEVKRYKQADLENGDTKQEYRIDMIVRIPMG
jgi:hypothetical protein